MKALILPLVVLSSSSAMAFINVPTTYPTKTDWAKAMTERACNVKFSKSAVGTITKNSDGSVTYTVFNKHGKVIAKALASSTFIGAEKVCVEVNY